MSASASASGGSEGCGGSGVSGVCGVRVWCVRSVRDMCGVCGVCGASMRFQYPTGRRTELNPAAAICLKSSSSIQLCRRVGV
jgi:hypothetical protein